MEIDWGRGLLVSLVRAQIDESVGKKDSYA